MNLKKVAKKLLLNIGLDVSIVRGEQASAALGKACACMDSPTAERKFIATTLLFDRLSRQSLADFADLVARNPEVKSLVSGVPEEHYRREVLRLGRLGGWGNRLGQSFFNPAYLMSQLTDSWDLVLYRQRRSENNQDVYVLRKKQRVITVHSGI